MFSRSRCARDPIAGCSRSASIESRLATASIVWHELRFGAQRLAPSRKRERVEAYLTQVVTALPILAYDAEAAEWHAAEKARLERAGTALGHADGQIAAVAVVTRNTRHFQGVRGLDVVSWHAR